MSMVDREVALTVRVTDNPKKLKPLERDQNVSYIVRLDVMRETDDSTYPMLIMIITLEMSNALSLHIWRSPSVASK